MQPWRHRTEAYHRESCVKPWGLAISSCRTVDLAASFGHGISRIGHKEEIRGGWEQARAEWNS